MTDDTGNVVEFPRPDAGELYWKCGCGCSTFWARYDKRIECAACNTISDGFGEWIVPDVEAPPVNAEPERAQQVVKLQTAEAAIRRVCEYAERDPDGTAAMMVLKDNGAVRTWNREEFDTEERRDWFDRKLEVGREMITGEKR